MATWREFYAYVKKREAMGIVFCYGPSCYREFIPCDPVPKTLICDRCGNSAKLPARVGEEKVKDIRTSSDETGPDAEAE